MPYECTVLGDTPPGASDRLSQPTEADLLPSLLSLLPRGRAWQTDEWEVEEGSTVLHRFWRAVAASFADVYRAATITALGSTVVTADPEYLDDWEVELGLPDPCVPPGATIAARRQAARLRLLPGGASAAFFVCYAGRLGWQIEIQDGFVPFEAGRSECGGVDGCLDDELFWLCLVAASEVDRYFEVGSGEVGLTPLGERPGREDLECVISRMAPAHTTVLFRYVDLSTLIDITADRIITIDKTIVTIDAGERDATD
jgi:uncharacterized protein YmfQ (DUF2313 family)